VSLTPSTMLPLGTEAPGFRLPDPQGRIHTLEDFQSAPALLVIFLCNHCPYVKHVQTHLAALTAELLERGVAVVGINANNAADYPEDRPERMAEVASRLGYRFPYLYDESQQVARAYRAACTPECYLFDRHRLLVYRGQYDDSRPGNDQPVTGASLRAAVDALLGGRPVSGDQRPSIGCNIKWRPGHEPEYFAVA